jgi:hypothetical protein
MLIKAIGAARRCFAIELEPKPEGVSARLNPWTNMDVVLYLFGLGES